MSLELDDGVPTPGTAGARGEEGSSPPAPRGPSGGSNRAALARLLLVVAVIVAAAAALHGLSVLVVILALVVIVMLHELGHFATAKWSGMKVTEYFLGFGPRIWSIRRGETEYGVKAIPAGGYVRIVGMTSAEQVADEDEPRSYRQASFPRRLLVAVAGSAVHFILAFVLLWVIFAFAGTSVSTRQIVSLPKLVGITSPARQAGLRPGDVILAVDGRPVSSGSALVSAIEGDAGKRITLTVDRHGKTVTLHATPVDGRHVEIAGTSTPAKSGSSPVGFLGVSLGLHDQTVGPVDAIGRGVVELGSVTSQTATGIATVFSLHGLSTFFHDVANAGSHHVAASAGTTTGKPASTSGPSGSSGQLLSIYGFVEVGSQALHQSIYDLLYLLVAINIFVGMVNLFPMLPLDGGHVLIAVYERIRSRRGRRYFADVNKLMPVAYVFLVFMVIIGLSALYANILSPPTLGG